MNSRVANQGEGGRGRGARRGAGRGRGRRGRGNPSSSNTGAGNDDDDDVILIEDPVPEEDHRIVPRRCHVVIEELVDEDEEDRLLFELAMLLDPLPTMPPMTASVGGDGGVGGNNSGGEEMGGLPMDVVEQLFSPWEQ